LREIKKAAEQWGWSFPAFFLPGALFPADVYRHAPADGNAGEKSAYAYEDGENHRSPFPQGRRAERRVLSFLAAEEAAAPAFI